MNIGDRVRFLSQTGGGIVAGFDKKGWALVEDEEGFRIPVPMKECVVVETNTVGKIKNAVNLSAGPGETVAAPGSVAGPRHIQTRQGDSLHIALVYTRTENKKTVPEFNCILANESNYNLLATCTVLYKGENTTVFAGEVLPYERNVIFTFGREALGDGAKKMQVRILPFKRTDPAGITLQGTLNVYKGVDEKRGWKPKEVVVKELLFDPVNLLKESSFKENAYLPERGYAVTIIKEGEPGPGKLEDLKKELLEKFNRDVKRSASVKTKAVSQEQMRDALVKPAASGVLEVDLHAAELLETTAGMGNTDILLYQLEKFNEVMAAHLHKKGTRIVFIHGKGDGVLRNALLKELKTKYSRCTWQDASFKEYGFGATMVTIR